MSSGSPSPITAQEPNPSPLQFGDGNFTSAMEARYELTSGARRDGEEQSGFSPKSYRVELISKYSVILHGSPSFLRNSDFRYMGCLRSSILTLHCPITNLNLYISNLVGHKHVSRFLSRIELDKIG